MTNWISTLLKSLASAFRGSRSPQAALEEREVARANACATTIAARERAHRKVSRDYYLWLYLWPFRGIRPPVVPVPRESEYEHESD